MFKRLVVACCVALTTWSVASAQQPSLRLPFMAGETWTLTRGYNTATHIDYGSDWLDDRYAVDFVESVCTSYGKPILAPSRGRVVFAGWTAFGYGHHVIIDHGGGYRSRLAHLTVPCVSTGEFVGQGQVVGWCGKSGNVDGEACDDYPGTHIHHAFYRNGDGVKPEPLSGYTDLHVGIPPCVSNNDSAFTREYDAMGQGGTFGSVTNGIEWSNGYNYADHYYSDGRAKTCYWQRYAKSSGGWYRSGIVYDALGGARKAYTIRTGFWDDDQGHGWSELGGPQSAMGMPLTEEYAWNGGARQDFQRGYQQYQNGVVSFVPRSDTPGWAGYWDNTFSYLFALAYERNGGAVTIGNPTGPVYNYGPYKRQDFTGGTYVNCCIMYDPNNYDPVKAPDATNEAYLLRTGFYEKYKYDPVTGQYNANGWYEAYGCPTRDEYATGDPGDAIQFFKRSSQNGNEQHHMYYDASSQQVSWNSTYTQSLVSVSPSAVANLQQGDAVTVEFRIQNTGQFVWYKDQGAQPYNYVTLQSCDVNGAIVPSFLYDGSWLDQLTPCTMLESSVAPEATATFRFTGRVSPTAPVGAVFVYFRPVHSVGGLMDTWSTSFKVDLYVERKIVWQFAGDLTGDLKGDVLLVATNGTYLYQSTGSGFNTPELVSSWVPTGMRCLLGDIRGLGKKQLVSVNPNDGIFVQTYDASANPKLSAPLRVCNWTPLASDSIACGDVNHDGKDDIVVTRSDGEYVLLSTGTWLNGPYTWKSGWSTWPYKLLVADYDHDQYADILMCSGTGTYYQYSTGSYFGNAIQLSTWSPYSDPAYVGYFTSDDRACILRSISSGSYLLVVGANGYYAGPYQWSTWSTYPVEPLIADVNGDGLDDVIGVFPATRQIAVLLSTGGSFAGPYTWYTGSGSTQPFALRPAKEEPVRTLSFSVGMNPVQGMGRFVLELPEASHVAIDLYDLSGRKVGTVFNGTLSAGDHSLTWNAAGNQAGMYFVRCETNRIVFNRKVVLLQ